MNITYNWWNTEDKDAVIPQTHLNILNGNALMHINKQIQDGCEQGQLLDDICDHDIPNNNWSYRGWWSYNDQPTGEANLSESEQIAFVDWYITTDINVNGYSAKDLVQKWKHGL